MSSNNFLEITTTGIKKGNYNKENIINVGIKAKDNINQNPICLYAVVDISGSMGCTVTQCEDTYISRLDLVIHSLKTIVNSLDENDQFCLISFNNNASLELKETSIKEKERILNEIKSLRQYGCTDIYAGIRLALDTLRDTNNNNVNNYIMVFTDGEQTISYQDSIYNMVRKKMEEDDRINYTLSTFTFGYDVDSNLMENIAQIGNGIYGFCPDFTMVGTVFINYLANIKTTLFPSIKVEFNGRNKNDSQKSYEQTIRIGGVYIGTERNAIFKFDENTTPSDVEGEITVSIIGRDDGITTKWNSGDAENCKIIDIDEYINNKNSEAQAQGLSKEFDENEYEEEEKTDENKDNNDNDDDDEEDDMADKDDEVEEDNMKKSKEDLLIEKCLGVSSEDKILNQVYRNKLLKVLEENNNSDIDLSGVANEITNLYNEIKEFYYKTEVMKGIMVDLKSENPNNGQIEKAFNEEFYKKWGCSYLKSFNRYHMLEQCGNFKDHSLKPYSGKKFIEKRNLASKIFLSTPLQTQPSPYDNRIRGSGNVGNSQSQGINTNRFLNRNGGCFNGDALVKLKGNTTKKVRELIKGDILSNGCQVVCVVEQPIIVKMEEEVEEEVEVGEEVEESLSSVKVCTVEGVQFSPYHPIYYKEKWRFPCDVTEVTKSDKSLDSWFNLVLEDDKKKYEVEFSIENENDTFATSSSSSSLKAITLGHGRSENSVLEHPYFGTKKVIKALQNKYAEAFKKGYIKTETTNIQRDNQNGLVNNYY